MAATEEKILDAVPETPLSSSGSSETRSVADLGLTTDLEKNKLGDSPDEYDLHRIRSGATDLSPDEQQEELERGMSRVESLDSDVVGWDGPEDKGNPYNWSKKKKWGVTAIVALMTFVVALASSIFTAGITTIAAQFGVSSTVGTLGLTLYVVGFATGPLVFAPMSEVYGRNIVYRINWVLFTVFQIGCARAENIATLLVCRLIAGITGAAPIANAGGTLGDIWSPAERGEAMALYAVAPFMGPVFGPIIGGFLTQYVSWRWTFWIVLILAGVMGAFMFAFLPETFGKTLLERKAARLRKETGRAELHAAHERAGFSHIELFRRSIVRPVVMLFTEPIVFVTSLYCAIVYAILYMNFIAYPIVFELERGWGSGIAGLPFIALGIGMVLAVMTSPYQTKIYLRVSKEKGNGKIYPEARLPLTIYAAYFMPISLLWFGWGSLRHVHWIVPVLSGIPFGFSMVIIFLTMMSYLVDTYLLYAASALASNSLLRSLLGATFPLFADQMYTKMHVKWAATMLAGISLLLAPMPLVFYRYGPQIRARSIKTPTMPPAPK
ncbi:major facilitator superfamily domain-containing protein [Dipodascopsis tothii]|uniref:major facilitator superfamily domain-containing protein n=1 Tax=Dipodascopsis tothii TaxID=44089 RepID=UPI0034CFB0F9